MKYAAIIVYTTGENTGATVRADTWHKLLDAFDGGKNIRQMTLAQVLTPERIIK